MKLRFCLLAMCVFAILQASAAPAAGDAAAGEAKAQVCFACHGPNGTSPQPTVPSLAAQPPLYIYYQLLQFREKRRNDPLMSPLAAPLTDRDMQDLAAYFSKQVPGIRNAGVDVGRIEQGRAVAERNHCQSCHAAGFIGQNHIPRLAGQGLDYLRLQLKGFKSGTRPDIDGTMSSAAQPLTDEDIENVVHFLASSNTLAR
jgi:cytochrome c553